eukprot:3853514-Pyramimonas_sp.AAC.1
MAAIRGRDACGGPRCRLRGHRQEPPDGAARDRDEEASRGGQGFGVPWQVEGASRSGRLLHGPLPRHQGPRAQQLGRALDVGVELPTGHGHRPRQDEDQGG